MKHLILMRHAKSSWKNLNLRDHERPLNGRGKKSCELIGSWLKENGFIPGQVISSSAERCAETWERVGLEMECDAKVSYEKGLYHSNAEILKGYLVKASSDTVAILAHNPGIGEFADRLVKTAPIHPRFYDYPTASTTIIAFDIDSWADVSFGSGDCLDFKIPADFQS